MRNDAILSGVYTARIEAVEALLVAADRHVNNAAHLRTLANALDEVTTLYGDTRVAVAYSGFASLIRTLAMLVDWRAGVLEAAVNADRFLRSARELHRAWLEEYGDRDEATGLASAAALIAELNEIGKVGSCCRAVGSVPLPIGIYAADTRRRILPPSELDDEDRASPPPPLSVAFIRFNIDGEPAGETHFLAPKEVHDLEIEVRISRWPDNANALCLTPVTIEVRSTHDFPVFRFPRPDGDPSYPLKQRGRAILHIAQGLRAQPFEFRYAADFEPAGVEQPVAVVGHRNLRVDCIDRPITGYDGVDRRLLEIRDELRRRPLVGPEDVTNTLALLAALGNVAGQAVQHNLFPGPLNERAFQDWVRSVLSARPEIGSKLEEHSRAAGGATDLSFERIRLELKSENHRPLLLNDCQRFIGQISSYAAGSDKRVSVLCVLDGSRKVEHPFPAEDGIGILKTGDDAIAVVTVLVQGNLARPSDLSRRAKRSPRKV
jgi:hypothetical protein